ncbi:hypothetical protein [Proteus mirabilis]|uniref:hypothetical protein n=1 Tax=Proteus mirabilis TaxID=584 RepID=UPI000B12EDE1|nr:hypothetical protein [Proteus mirabilis]
MIDRESYSIKLDSLNGFKISNTLSLNDIFSFDVLEKDNTRHNFEKLFNKYETDIKKHSDNLIIKLKNKNKDIKSEIVNIFLSKTLNFIRNPYSINKILNTYSSLRNMHPTDLIHYKNYERILNGRKPHQQHICQKLGITERKYKEWLSIIFLLLIQFEKNQFNIFEQSVKSLFEDKNLLKTIYLYTFDEKSCLLSDRGYSIPFPEDQLTSWDFNINSKCFIRYIFADIKLFSPINTPRTIYEQYKNNNNTIYYEHINNDLNELEKYNRNLVYQCHKNIYNSTPECYGL